MKPIYSLFLLLLFPLIAFSQTDTVNVTDKQGRKQGIWRKIDKQGNKLYQGQFKDNQEYGNFTYYYPSGKVKSTMNYTANGVIAFNKNYSEEGNLLSEGIYKNRKKDSIWNYYRPSGEKLAQETYKAGKKEGTWFVYSNGEIEESIEWKNDKQSGKWYRKMIKGGYLIGNYENDQLQGTYEEFNDDNTVRIKGRYVKGAKEGEWDYYDSQARLAKVDYWRNNVLTKSQIILYTPSGNTTILANDVAYMYAKGRTLVLTTFDGKIISSQNSIDEVVDLLEVSNFEMLNWEMKLYARASAIEKIEVNPENDKRQVFLNPPLNIEVYEDRK